MCLEEKVQNLRRNTNKFVLCPEKNLLQAKYTKKEKIVTFATKNVAATSNRQTPNETEKKISQQI